MRHLIEHTTAVPLDTALQRLIFMPLGITGTHITTTASEMAHTSWRNPTGYDPQWVFHGLLIGPPTDAVVFLDGLLAGRVLSAMSLEAMQDQRMLGGPLPGRPWTQTGYGLGLMMGEVYGVGHSGVGHDSVSALYAFLDVPGRPVVSAFAPGTDEGMVEHETLRLALTGCRLQVHDGATSLRGEDLSHRGRGKETLLSECDEPGPGKLLQVLLQ